MYLAYLNTKNGTRWVQLLIYSLVYMFSKPFYDLIFQRWDGR